MLSHDNVMTLYSLKSMATPHVLWSNSLSFLIGGWPWVPYPEPFVKPLENFEMKKTLVAVAALAAFSGAYAQATISGVIDYAITVDGTASTLGFGPNGGNEFTVASSEDLGNGLKASGAVTVIATGGDVPFQTYNSFIGVDGGFGSIKLGSQWSPMFFASTISDPLARWGGANLANPAQLQNDKSLTYTSPAIAGVTVQIQQQLGGADYEAPASAWLNTGVEATTYSITYSNSGFNAAYATNSDAGVDTTLIAASYDFGMASIHYGNLTNDGDKSNTIGVVVPFGALAVKLSASSNDADESNTSLQLTYALGKKTMAYLTQANAATTTTTVGLKHAF